MIKPISSTFFILITLLFISTVDDCIAQPARGVFEVQPGIGVHQTNLKWAIAGNKEGGNPNVLSEVSWKDLRGIQFGLDLGYGLTDKVGIRIASSFLNITSGLVRDIDYAGDNRQGIFYEQEFNSNKGHDLSIDAVMDYCLFQRSAFQLRPFLGFEFRQQNLVLLDQPGLEREIPLNSNYQTTWQGFVFGTTAIIQLAAVELNTSLSAGLLNYRARARWNLIEEFAQPLSFAHRSGAYAIKGRIAIAYPLYDQLKIVVNAGTVYAKVWPGIDEVFYVSRKPIQTQLNEVRSFSYQLSVGLKYTF